MARLWLLILVVLFAAPAAWADPPEGVNPEFAAEGQRLAALVTAQGHFRLTQATSQEFVLTLDDEDGRTAGMLHVGRDDPERSPRARSEHYTYEVSNFTPDNRVTDALIHAAGVLAAHDGGMSENPHPRQPVPDLGILKQATAALAAFAVVLGVLRRGKVSWEIRLPHLIPATVQVIVFAYWSLYSPAVRDHVPSLVLQVAMGFAADAAFSFLRFGSWRFGSSPLPVVLSSNLFVWLDPHGVMLCILAAFATKTFVRRQGRHVLNPSAIGLSVAGAVSYLWRGSVHVGGLFHTLSLAPNMAELMVLIAMVPQSRFRILPISITAVLVLRMLDNPTVLRPPMVLAVALLATDPSTIPQTDGGKVLFGAFVAVALVYASIFLRGLGFTDDFAKVFPVPVANLLVPLFDGVALFVAARIAKVWGHVTARVDALAPLGRWASRPLPNLVFMALWLGITLAPLRAEKPRSFEPTLHWNLGTPLVVRDADDVPRCDRNPVFCEPFTFVQELALWRRARR